MILAAIVLSSLSCTVDQPSKKKLDRGVEAAESDLAKSSAIRDTIASYAYFDGVGPLRIRGFGLVVGLGKNGSGECPRTVREQLVQSLYKQHQFFGGPIGSKPITPEQLIDDPDTAVVLVRGEVPGASIVGTRFDVTVSAIPGTKTKSLEGGRLYTTELEIFRETSPNTSISGRIVAKAAGRIFLNPFSDENSATPTNLLEGIVIGGGKATKPRELRLVLSQPSYGIAKRIQDRINNHFDSEKRVANAISPSFIEIRLPDKYDMDPGHFVALVKSLYLSTDPQFEGVRARELAEEIPSVTAPHGLISLCFEGMGRESLSILSSLYSHPAPHAGFHAALAGLRLEDHVAVDAVARHAENPRGEYRIPAIHALAEAKGMANSASALQRLLQDADASIRVAAYEALVLRQDPAVVTRTIAGDNFALDRAISKRENLIYAKRHGSRRIALLGDDFRCSPPVHFVARDGSITINALEGAAGLTLVRSVLATGAHSPAIEVGADVANLVQILGRDAEVDGNEKVIGLGVDFAVIIRALRQFCDDGSINARFILEEPLASELPGLDIREGRPESEE